MQLILHQTWNDPDHNNEVRFFFMHVTLTRIEQGTEQTTPYYEVNLDAVTTDNPAEYLERIPDDYIESLRSDLENFLRG